MVKTSKRHVWAGAGVIAMISAMAVGCGTQTPNQQSPTVSSAESASVQSSIPRGITLHVLSYWQPEEMKVIKTLAAKWAKLHGDTVIVEQNSATGNSKYSNWAQEVRAGTGPDVAIAMPADNLGTFYEEGLLAPATLMKPSDYPTGVADGVKIAGKYYGYPVAVQSVALIYNKKLVPTPPRTWSQFVQDANKHGFAFAQEQFWYDYAFIGGMGGYIFGQKNGSFNPNDIGLATPGAIAGFKLLQDMDLKYHWMNPSVNQSIATSEFDEGKVGMFMSGPWDIEAAIKSGINVGVAPMPTLPNGKPATPLISNLTAIVSARTKYLTAAESLAQYLTNETAELLYYKADEDLPAMSALHNNPEILKDPIARGFLDQLNTAVATPNIAQMQAVYSAQSIIPDILSGKISAEAGAKQFVQEIKTAISVQQG
ncbi:sugar ABC transporter substrate-binding protein [Alicyclobacillus sendaiensis]|uniref:sugar ABC transporter substrate-binding protein n=1 Tax=Alicyclobacillus sendaiensis TaxID=192387 RepID=UPI000B262D77|nr:maltose ABC transporter substrate-binding protein [Alicyclobacillus sendaiensis]